MTRSAGKGPSETRGTCLSADSPTAPASASPSCGLITSTVGADMLAEIARGYIDLVGTCSAVYELEGECVVRVTSAGSCLKPRGAQAEDSEGHRVELRTRQDGIREAAARRAIASGEPADGEFADSIRIYAVPIKVGGRVVGAIDFGYGAPASEPGLSMQGLERKAVEHWRFQPEVVQVAKSQLRTAAMLIGEIIARRLAEASSRQAERAATEAEHRLRLLLESSPLGVVEWDADFRITSWNRAAESIFGWPAAEVIGQRFPALPIASREELESLRAQRPVAWHHRNRRKDGSAVECDWYHSANFDSSGRLVSCLLQVLDVSQRVAAESALHDNERRWRAAIDHFPKPVVLYDSERRVEYVNPAGLRIAALAGLAPAEYLGRRDEEIFPPAIATGFLEAQLRAFETGRPQTHEWTVPGEYGGQSFVIAFIPLRGEAGGNHQMLGLADDVTEHRRSEEVLRDGERRWREFSDMLPQLVWTCGSDGSADYLGRQWGEFTGIPSEQQLGFRWLDQVHPDDRELVAAAWEGAVERGSPLDRTYRIRAADGGFRWFKSRAVPVRDEDGRLLKWFGTSTDVDDQVRLEQRLQEADRRKDEFLATLGHELRNPLSPIANSLFILERAARPEQSQRALEVMTRQVRHLSRLVDDLLDVSRISRGKIELRKQRLDLNELVSGALEDHRGQFERAGLALDAALPEGPVFVYGDPTRIAQAVGNLLMNASKFTDRGGRVHLTLEVEAQQGARVTVRDTGIGLDPETLARLFEPFSQADRSLARTRGGLGLGLALVKGLVELHGGRVGASSPGPGRGATFELRLPLASGQMAHSSSRSVAMSVPGASRRVLVVEDNLDAAASLKEILEMDGHEVAVANDGPAAVALAGSFRPEVVLCDIGLPGSMDGYAVARALRSAGSIGPVQLVALTGYASPEDQRRAREAGFDAHLAKPPDLEVLERLLAAAPPSFASALSTPPSDAG